VSLGLLLPAGLAALFALLLPLVLHLARRTEQQPVMFAALRWLRVRQRPRQRIRLEEWLLLTLRLLLLAALALLLAQPVLHGAPGSRHWVVVAPGIDPARARAAVAAPNAEWRWLASGFPALERDPPAGSPPLASLLRELDATLPEEASLSVVVPARIHGLDGERVALHRKVEWRALESEGTPTPAAPPGAAVLAVRHARPDEPALRYLRAAGAAWSASAPDPDEPRVRVGIAAASEPIEPTARWLVWLVPGEVPPAVREWIEAGGTALLDAATEAPQPDAGVVLWRDAGGEALVTARAMGNGRVLQLTRALAPAAMPEVLDPDFPDRLLGLFDPPPLPQSAFATTQAPSTGGPQLSPKPRPLHPWLAVLVATLFMLERWLATSRRREHPA
jgi:Aerotolerance regulator N-terminal